MERAEADMAEAERRRAVVAEVASMVVVWV